MQAMIYNEAFASSKRVKVRKFSASVNFLLMRYSEEPLCLKY